MTDVLTAILTFVAVTAGLWSLGPVAPNPATADAQLGAAVIAGACAGALTLIA